MSRCLTCLAAALIGVAPAAAVDYDIHLEVDVATLVKHPAGVEVLKLIDGIESAAPPRQRTFLSRLGLKNIERAVVVATVAERGAAFVATLTMKRPIDAALMQRLGAVPAGRWYRDRRFGDKKKVDIPMWPDPRFEKKDFEFKGMKKGGPESISYQPPTPAGPTVAAEVYVIDRMDLGLVPLTGRRLAVVGIDGPGGSLARMLAVGAAGGDGPLSRAVAAAKGHHVVLGLRVKSFAKIVLDGPLAAGLALKGLPVVDLAAAETAVMTADLGESLAAGARLAFADARAAGRVGRAGGRVMAALADGLNFLGEEMTGSMVEPKPLRDIFALAATALKAGQVKADGTVVTASAAMELGPKFNAGLKALAKVAAGEARFAQAANNLKQIATAMHDYHDVYQGLPGAGGNLSWRVYLLPNIEQEALYRRFRLDEPWDSDHNKKLIPLMPRVFAIPGREAKAGMTYFRRFTTKGNAKFRAPAHITGAAPRPGRPPRGAKLSGITNMDGPAYSIMIVEAAEAEVWTKPGGLPLPATGKLPKLGGAFRGGFLGAMCDATIHRFPHTLKPQTVRRLATYNDGYVIPAEEWSKLNGRPARRLHTKSDRPVYEMKKSDKE